MRKIKVKLDKEVVKKFVEKRRSKLMKPKAILTVHKYKTPGKPPLVINLKTAEKMVKKNDYYVEIEI